MNHSSIRQPIKFTLSETKEKNTKGQTRYQGQLTHNQVLSERETRLAFAEFCRESTARAGYHIDMLMDFICEQIQAGNHLDFGSFSVGLRIRGSFTAVNDEFSPTHNRLVVELTPGKALKEATQNLKPINVTTGENSYHINSILQQEPVEKYEEMAASGSRKVSIVGSIPPVHAESSDEGIWIENDTGEILAKGNIIETSASYTVSRWEDPIPVGTHWLCLQGRYRGDAEIIRVRRRIHVVPDSGLIAKRV